MMKLLTNTHLFWDADTKLIDPKIHQQSIIERVLERGSWADVKELIEFYGKEEIADAAKKARWFSDKTTHFVSGYFHIPLEQMRCFKEKQLNPIHYL